MGCSAIPGYRDEPNPRETPRENHRLEAAEGREASNPQAAAPSLRLPSVRAVDCCAVLVSPLTIPPAHSPSQPITRAGWRTMRLGWHKRLWSVGGGLAWASVGVGMARLWHGKAGEGAARPVVVVVALAPRE